jgi:hypothetical protein
MNKQTACGKAAKRTAGYGVQSMSIPVMKKFIEEHGTESAKKALKAIKGAPSRGALCSIFHVFAAGRKEIAAGEGMRNYKFSPNRQSSPPRRTSPPRRSSPSSSSSSSRRTSRSSSPNMNQIFAMMQAHKKALNNNMLARKILRTSPKKPNYPTYLKPGREYHYGVKVLTGRPERGQANNNYGNNGSRGSGNSYNNNNFFGKKNVHFRRGGLNNVRNMVELKKKKKPKASRFNMNNNMAVFLPGNVSGRRYQVRSQKKKRNYVNRSVAVPFYGPAGPQPFSPVRKTRNANSRFARVPVRAGYHQRLMREDKLAGSQSSGSMSSLKKADAERWRMMKQMRNNRLSQAQKNHAANRLLTEVLGRKSPPIRREFVNFKPLSKKSTKYKILKKFKGRAENFRAVNANVGKPLNLRLSNIVEENEGGSLSPGKMKKFRQGIQNARARAVANRKALLGSPAKSKKKSNNKLQRIKNEVARAIRRKKAENLLRRAIRRRKNKR